MDELEIQKRLKKLRELPKIQYDSTTPMDEYHTGMYNGLECALAIIDDREPKYLDVEKKRPRRVSFL